MMPLWAVSEPAPTPACVVAKLAVKWRPVAKRAVAKRAVDEVNLVGAYSGIEIDLHRRQQRRRRIVDSTENRYLKFPENPHTWKL